MIFFILVYIFRSLAMNTNKISVGERHLRNAIIFIYVLVDLDS